MKECFPIVENEHCKICPTCKRKYNWLVSDNCYFCDEKEIKIITKLQKQLEKLVKIVESYCECADNVTKDKYCDLCNFLEEYENER